MDPQTLRLLREALRQNVLAKVSHERIWYELKVILNEPEPVDVLNRLNELGVWEQIFPEITYWEVQPVLEELPQALMVLRNWGWNEPVEKWLPYLIAMLHWSNMGSAIKVCERFVIGRRQTEKIITTIKHWRKVLGKLSDPMTDQLSQQANILQLLPREAYPMFLAIMDNKLAIQRFRQVMESVRQGKPLINGRDLKRMGYKPGPVYRKVFDALWQARLDGIVITKDDELEFVEQYMCSLQKGEQARVW
jgi:tRNA nucleotidyltransferase (CCA-adding enzyme)